MAKSKKPARVSKRLSKINEKNVLIVLLVALVVCVGVVLFKEQSKKTEISEPTTVEQTEGL